MRVLRWINPVTANLSSNESNKGLGKDEKKKGTGETRYNRLLPSQVAQVLRKTGKIDLSNKNFSKQGDFVNQEYYVRPPHPICSLK